MPAPAISVVNSTADLLTAGSSFQGTVEAIDAYTVVTISIIGSLATAPGTLYFQTSHDDTTYTNIPRTIENITIDVPHTFRVAEKYFKIKYTNGSVSQTGTFSIQTTYSNGDMLLSHVPGDVATPATESTFVRQIGNDNLDRNAGLVSFHAAATAQGTNSAVGNGALEVLREVGGSYSPSIVDEAIRVRSGGNAADTSAGNGARTISVTFLGTDWLPVTETITLAGASASSSTSATCVRLQSAEVLTTGTLAVANTGDILIENATSNELLGTINAGVGEMVQAIYTVPGGKTAYITDVFVSVGQADSADVFLYVIEDVTPTSAPFNSVHREWGLTDFSGAADFPLLSYLVVPEKSDIYMMSQRITGSGSAKVVGRFEMILVDN